ncbi:rod shape-determining protein MreC [Danxiaibacter flavus]|uniref:Cell shape-determining protein MreC n=1 Tax=Danxiaibacter flavus TaxID=3049108 RepID=A0ABV3ZKB9_9BACT|nr:rod shape-determining protein MreC [Chitinophagaceae bacterium DXS]
MFLVLQGLSIAILVKYNKTHEAVFSNVAGQITGKMGKQYNNVEYYFRLKETNKQLEAENARLRNELLTSFEGPDSTKQQKLDSLLQDSTYKVRVFTYLPAKVVNNSVNEENNYITLYRGRKQGIHPDMAVVGPDGVVGRVIMVSDNYCRVMSMLNHKSGISAMLKKGAYNNGVVEWDGKDASIVVLRNIPKTAKIQKGDTVLTSNLSGIFPPGLMIGQIDNFSIEPSGSTYNIKVKAATNFFTMQYAYIIDNANWNEQKQLEAQTPKN